jgi:hypothetical protein
MDSHPLQHGEKNLKNNGVYLKLGRKKNPSDHTHSPTQNRIITSLKQNYIQTKALQISIPYFHFPASSTPLATRFAPSSSPVVALPSMFPTGSPVLPVALVIVSPIPRPAVPVTPPKVRVTPPTVFPSVEVTNLAAPVTPLSWEDVSIGMVV